VWLSAPDNEVGTPVPVHLVLARTDRIALAVLNVVAFSTGFSFRLALRRRHAPDRIERRICDDFDDGVPSADVLRFGVQYADGRKATTLGQRFTERPDEARSLVLFRGSSSGNGRSYDSNWWVWPLPPRGPVAFVCEWAAESIPLTRREVDADLVLEAARRAEALWPEEPEEPDDNGGAWTAYGSFVDG
jgi:hypothetical protein